MAKSPNASRYRFGLAARTLWLTAVFILLFTAVVLWQSVSIMSRQINQNNLQATEYRLKTAVMTIAQRVNEIDHLADWCSVNSSMRTFLFSNLSNPTLTNAVYANLSAQYSSISSCPYIQRLLVVSNSGRIIMLGTAVSQSTIVSSGNIPLLETDTAWEKIVKDPLILPGSRVSGIPISRTIESGQREALVYISVSPSLILDVVKDFYRGQSNTYLYLYMGGQAYDLSSGQMSPLELIPSYDADTSGSTPLSQDTLLYRAEKNGEDFYVVISPIGSHDMYLAAEIPSQSLLDQLPQMLPTLLVAALLVPLLGCLLAALLHRITGTPVKALRRQIERISQGNFETDPTIEWNHELGDVGRGINHLAKSVTALMARAVDDEKQKQELEFRMLQSQINPHFVYNALNSIQWMAAIQHATGISEMATALSRLLKSVAKSNEQLIPLEEELKLLNDYFTIQRYRYGGTITLDILWEAEETQCLDILIPRFTLQPLAENAVFHGIEPKGCAGKLTLTFRMDECNLLIQLTDDGIGMTQEQIDALLAPDAKPDKESKFRHVGIQNVHRRLKFSFGPDYGLQISSTPSVGTTITIRIPIQKGDRKHESNSRG